MFLEKFKKLTITDYKKLEEYIAFCLEKDKKEKLDNTELHHVLPQAKSCFPEYKDLKKNTWNGVLLAYEDHYKAHAILAEAVDNYSIISAWWGMNNKQFALGKIKEGLEIIGREKYTLLKELHSKKASEQEFGKVRCRDSNGNKVQVSKEEYHNRDDLTHSNKGYVLCKDKNGEFLKITKEEYDKREDLVGSTTNQVSVILKESGKKIMISKEDYKNNKGGYLHHNTGKLAGMKTHTANIIKIYNDKDIEQYCFEGGFIQGCKENNLPHTAFGKSHRNNGEPLYQNLNKTHDTKLRKRGWLKYKGWYAIKAQ